MGHRERIAEPKQASNKKNYKYIMKTSVATLLIATPCNGYTDPYGVDPERDDLSTIDCSNYNGMCTREYMPICRNDGHTSSNVCVFLSEYCMGNVNLRFWKWANMDGGELCPKMLNDGGINEKKEEEEEEQCNLNCPRMLDFVCGTDGVKYPNPCILKGKACQEKTDVRVAFRTLTGDCCQKFCSRIGLPVCGSDGKTYGNECLELQHAPRIKTPKWKTYGWITKARVKSQRCKMMAALADSVDLAMILKSPSAKQTVAESLSKCAGMTESRILIRVCSS